MTDHLRRLGKRDRKQVMRLARRRTWMVRVVRGRKACRLFLRGMKTVGTWTIPELCMDLTVMMANGAK